MEYINQLKMLQLGSDSHVDLEKVFNKKQTFDRLAALFPTAKGKLLSYEERKADANHSTTLVYGEIKFEPFAIAIEKIKRKYGGLAEPGKGVYYDIGSGTGKPVFAAVLMHSFERAVGIEILESLHNAALETLKFWNSDILKMVSSAPSDGEATDPITNAPEATAPALDRPQTKIDFVRGDITRLVSWCNVFISEQLWRCVNSLL